MFDGQLQPSRVDFDGILMWTGPKRHWPGTCVGRTLLMASLTPSRENANGGSSEDRT